MSPVEGERVRRRVRVDGRVQGVGFRWFTLSAARREGVGGWVRNASDGSVLCEVEGLATRVERFLVELRRGPRRARVDDLAVESIAPTAADDGFEIR